ncbi:MAG: polyprenyl synthetase family protein [Bacteroidota bacterium]
MSATSVTLSTAVAEVEAGLAAIALPDEPDELYAPVQHALEGKGKRVRPAMLLLTAEAVGGAEARARAMPAALAVEVFHTFTLVHDDIMDDAPTRRGRPTIHATWDAATAILAGDLLFSISADLLRRTETARLGDALGAFHAMVARLCEGQALDLAFETRRDVTPEAYLDMIDRKTGALLELALDLGALVGGATDANRQRLREAGHALGRAFQIQDDLLDLTAEADALGKPIGGDLVQGKRAWLLLRAIERAETDDDRAFFDAALDGLAPDLVPEARARMDRLGVLAEASEAARRYAEAGTSGLDVLPDGPAADALRDLARSLATRGT